MAEAAKSVRHTSWFEVVEQRGSIKDGKVHEFQVTVRSASRSSEPAGRGLPALALAGGRGAAACVAWRRRCWPLGRARAARLRLARPTGS